ncbi:hypothetical protein MCBMB27_05678 (plasmid) [Methylobacterium phyllosphaerae]|uniref:Ferritin-like n=1 Tax=Methylobacterium phyllosphaerae TaxID=418223 RepID=A0AAE8HXQ1_9HYPH|nr:ferritin-like domain-containing protein [Methylobacterium phyllosphaerae]APT34969.1 hypothetical protein MCBMB27_05678 [Methylobacterium phyllosphaerae]SFH65865.1 Ferritin-like [Methylobacterium phyllosphaerae]
MSADPAALASRSRLLSLLTEACELEHGLACSYLYAAFSLKQDLSEGGLDWRQLQAVRLWASEIYMVAAEEMLHLAQVWNILAAVGGSPHYGRPNFPQRRTYYGFDQPLALEGFGSRALDRFISYETPLDLLAERTAAPARTNDDEPARFRSVGELYGLIAEQIRVLPEESLFFSGSQGEMTPEIAHFPDLLPVRDARSALAAIALITEQGEGTACDRGDSHYATFLRTRAAFEAQRAADPAFRPTRPVLDNPVPRIRGDWAGGGPVNVLIDPLAREVGDLFDDVYVLMLRLLQHAFTSGPSGPMAGLFCGVAIDAMTTVLKPLGETLALLPSGRGDDTRAGAAFGLTRHTTLPPAPAIALRVAAERAADLTRLASRLAGRDTAPERLGLAVDNLKRIASALGPMDRSLHPT